MTLEQAKHKILSTVNFDIEQNDQHIIDEKNVVDHDFAWYIPFIKKIQTDETFIGAWNGFFVDKGTEEIFRPGSGLPLQRWLIGFKIGLRYKKYDLHILNIYDKHSSVQFLKKINLKYYVEESDGGIFWKIPKSFSEKMILQRLENIPTVFQNQSLTFCIDVFEEIISSRVFEFKLKANISLSNTAGENLTDEGVS